MQPSQHWRHWVLCEQSVLLQALCLGDWRILAIRIARKHSRQGSEGVELLRPAAFTKASGKRQKEERRGWRSQKQLSLERRVWRAGVRHEGTEADVPVTAWHFMGCTVGFFNTFSSDTQTHGHSACQGHTVREWPGLTPQWSRPLLSGEELGWD